GGLEVLDFDDPAAWEVWASALERKRPGLLARLPRARTPSGGMHVYLRRPCARGNRKLAYPPRTKSPKARIETRGESGYAIAPGAPPETHAAGRPYVWVVMPEGLTCQ